MQCFEQAEKMNLATEAGELSTCECIFKLLALLRVSWAESERGWVRLSWENFSLEMLWRRREEATPFEGHLPKMQRKSRILTKFSILQIRKLMFYKATVIDKWVQFIGIRYRFQPVLSIILRNYQTFESEDFCSSTISLALKSSEKNCR